jgi:hypothetical protein
MTLHKCAGHFPSASYGSAIDQCREFEDGTLWVDNDEYSNRVNFCPYCGYRAQKLMQFMWVDHPSGNGFEPYKTYEAKDI